MKKCFSHLCNLQLQSCQQHEPRLSMFQVKSFPSSEVGGAWKLVCTKTGTDEAAIRRTYTEAVAAVEKQARNIYKEDPFNPVPNSEEFVQIMIDQGCFILQVALFSLGASQKLNNDWSNRMVEALVPILFDIRSQLPLVVLKELMKQSFFKKLLKSRKQWRRPKDIAGMIFFDQLVEPMLEGPCQMVNFLKHKSLGFLDQQPPTLLHALWLHHIGPSAIIGDVDGDGDKEYERRSCLLTVRSATELNMMGITFKNNKGKGSRGIEFKEIFNAVLSLPSITVEPNTEALFNHLIDYELETKLGKTQLEVCSYLKLMGELIRTPGDAKLLAMQGIVDSDPKGEMELPEILKRLPLPKEVGDTQHMVDVRYKIRSYVKPSMLKKVTKSVIVITLILGLLQTFYSIVSYYHCNSKGNS